jgi:hypothetical protein
MHFTGPDGVAAAQTGLSAAVLHRDADGAWRAAIVHPYANRFGGD